MIMETLYTTQTERLDKQALIHIYEEYSPKLFRYAMRQLGDQDMAEECVSETFSRFLNSLKGGREPVENLQAYLYRVAHNWITDSYRRQPLPTEPLEADSHVDTDGNPAGIVARQMEQERLRQALLRLPPEQRRVVALRFLEQWSHEEIAVAMDKTVEATRAIQYRAMKTLRSFLTDSQEDHSITTHIDA
jgi:RNA polymerase sigma-70 factor (ECF subfamily)